MNGADVLCDTLLASGIDTCFANPGTSEMHFVAALDRRPEMRCILGLFEGVVTGAADGYARMTDRPAATLLHTGPGLANGLAGLHNARRAHAPIVNVVGDHASHHLAFDAPLTSDIESLARPMSAWVGRVAGPDDVARAAREAHRAAVAGRGVATLILPADAAWGSVSSAAAMPGDAPVRPAVPSERIREIAAMVQARQGRCGVVLSGPVARAGPLAAAARIAAATGARLFGDMFMPRVERGRGRVPIARIPYPVDQALKALADCDLLVLVNTQAPVAFFAYPGKPSGLTRPDARVITLADPVEDGAGALEELADRLGGASTPTPHLSDAPVQARLDGPLTDEAAAQVIARNLPHDAIVVDEALTSIRSLYGLTADAPPHDYLMACPGGAIGAGLPVAVGAAVACPDRKVICMQADGSGLYTAQALWTQARENLDVVTIIFANRAYAILQHEMRAVGVERIGRNAERMLTLDHPAVDWVSLARGMGVEAVRAETAGALESALTESNRRRGPFLIEARL